MPLDPRLPVVVGVGQLVRRPRPEDVPSLAEPADMMVEALRLAAADSGAGDALLQRADSIRIVDLLSWRYANPAALVAERIGASPRETLRTTTGGNTPQALVNDTAAAIQRGDLDVALVAGAEAIYTRLLARKTKDWLQWTQQGDGTPAPVVYGDDRPGTNDVEQARSIVMPTQVYPMFENALRAGRAAPSTSTSATSPSCGPASPPSPPANPYAWSPRLPHGRGDPHRHARQPHDRVPLSEVHELQHPDRPGRGRHRLLGRGGPRRWACPRTSGCSCTAGADAHDHWCVSERADLARRPPPSPPCGRSRASTWPASAPTTWPTSTSTRASPSAVQIAAAELGLGASTRAAHRHRRPVLRRRARQQLRRPTRIAAMVDALRADPGSLGLATALGWYVTKHSLGLYSTSPPASGSAARQPQDAGRRPPPPRLTSPSTRGR